MVGGPGQYWYRVWHSWKRLATLTQLVKERDGWVTWFWHFLASNFHETFTRSSLAIIYVDPIGPFQAKFNFPPQNTCCSLAGWQNLAAFVGSKNGNENFCQVRIYNVRVKCLVFARNRKFAKLTQWNMQYIPCKSALLAPETLSFFPARGACALRADFLTGQLFFFCLQKPL